MQEAGEKFRISFRAHDGSIMNMMAAVICILAMTIIVAGYFGCVGLLEQKACISQTARRYLLRMETVGYLTENDRQALTAELSELGAVDLDFTGSTLNKVAFGSSINLVIRGKIAGQRMALSGNLFETAFDSALYEFEERKMSTAKN